MERIGSVQRTADIQRRARRNVRFPNQAERRDAPRLPGRVRFSAGRQEGTGLIEDLSLSGAHIAEANWCPDLGTQVRLFFASKESERPLCAFGRVIRSTGSSFAVRFKAVEQGLQGLLLAAGSSLNQ